MHAPAGPQAFEALQPTAAAPADTDAGDKTDIEALLKSEVAELKDNSKQRFFWQNLAAGSLIYVDYRSKGARACLPPLLRGGLVHGGWLTCCEGAAPAAHCGEPTSERERAVAPPLAAGCCSWVLVALA